MAENTLQLIQRAAEIRARLNLIPYEGTPEIKEIGGARYLYVRKREGGKLRSTYVGTYSEELHELILRNVREARELRKELRKAEKALAEAGYHAHGMEPDIARNLDFARANMKASIYDQAILEGVSTTFPQTEEIIDGGKVYGMSATDVQKVLNLKRAWEFILDPDVLSCPSDYSILCHIARLVNEGFYMEGGKLRSVPVSIGGTSYRPPLPFETVVKETLADILAPESGEPIDTAISLCLYCMKSQLFIDGNKRTAVIFANHYLIRNAGGLIVIPYDEVDSFRTLLIAHYEGRDRGEIRKFLKEKCWKLL